MAEEQKSRSNYSRLQIYERDPTNEPSMQLESMAELDDLDQIGALDFVGQQSVSYTAYSKRQQQQQSSNQNNVNASEQMLAISKAASVVGVGNERNNTNQQMLGSRNVIKNKSQVSKQQIGRTLNQSLESRESKDQPTIEQSNPRIADETFNQLHKGLVTIENGAEDVQDSCCISMSYNADNSRVHNHNMPLVVQATEYPNEENIEPTVGNDDSQISGASHNFDSRVKYPQKQQLQDNNKGRLNIQTGSGTGPQTSSRGVPVSINTNRRPTNIPYTNEKEVRLDRKNRNIEEFPFWEVTQKNPQAIDLSQNSICEWPAQPSIQKCKELEELVIADNYLNRIPGYIVSAYSRLKRLDLRNNQIESMPTLPKKCSILRYIEHLDLGQNRLKLFPTSFIMSIGHGDSSTATGTRNGATLDNSSVASAHSEQYQYNNSASLTAGQGQIRLTRLKALFLDGNLLDSIPAEIGDHENLSILHLQDNKLAQIPASIFLMPGLRNGQLGLEWFMYVDPPLKCPFPPQNAPSDTMPVFMDLALQMCTESEKISSTGQVKFLQFVEYFSQKPDSDLQNAQQENQNNQHPGILTAPFSASSLGLLTETHDFYEKLIVQTVKVESHLKKAACAGHIGVINSLIGSEKAIQRYKEGQFRLSQRKLELFGDDTATMPAPNSINQHNPDELSPLAMALLEQQSDAALALIDAGADQMNGFGTFGTALHLAVVQANHKVLEHLLQQNIANIDIRNSKFETPLHIVMQKLSTSSTTLDMLGARSRVRQANQQTIPNDRVAAKIKFSDNSTIQAELRLKAIAEQLIMSGADLTAQEQASWSYVHIASKSFSSDTLRWMLATNIALKQLHLEPFDFEQPGGSKNWTPLHVACYTGAFEVIEELIERANCDVFSRSLNDKLPRQVARNTIVAKVLRIAEKKVINKQLNSTILPQQHLVQDQNSPNRPQQRQKVIQTTSKDSSRHNFRVGEHRLLYQQLMDQEPAFYAMESQKKQKAMQNNTIHQNQQNPANSEKPYQNTNSLSQVLARSKSGTSQQSQSLTRQASTQRVSSIQIDKQKYVSLSFSLRKCKAIQRKKEVKREKKQALLLSVSAAADHQQQNEHQYVQNLRQHQSSDQEDKNDMSVMSVSSCCFSEEILQEHVLMRAN